jgi:hypothetical protein
MTFFNFIGFGDNGDLGRRQKNASGMRALKQRHDKLLADWNRLKLAAAHAPLWEKPQRYAEARKVSGQLIAVRKKMEAVKRAARSGRRGGAGNNAPQPLKTRLQALLSPTQEVPGDVVENEDSTAGLGAAPSPFAIQQKIDTLLKMRDASLRAEANYRRLASAEVARKGLLWEVRYKDLMQKAARSAANARKRANEIAQLRMRQRASTVKPLSTPVRDTVVAAYNKHKTITSPYRPPGATVHPVTREWLKVPDVMEKAIVTQSTAPTLFRHYDGLLRKHDGRMSPEVRARFIRRRALAAQLARLQARAQGEAFVPSAARTVPTANATLLAQIAEQRARFERARRAKNYAESTRTAEIISKLEAQLRALQSQQQVAPTVADVPVSPPQVPYSPLAPVEYTAAKLAPPGASAEADADAVTDADAATDTYDTEDTDIAPTPWYKSPFAIVGGIAAIAVAAIYARGQKGKKGQGGGTHSAAHT